MKNWQHTVRWNFATTALVLIAALILGVGATTPAYAHLDADDTTPRAATACDYRAYLAGLSAVHARFCDAFTRAAAIPAGQMSTAIADMQRARGDLLGLHTPDCAAAVTEKLAQAMDDTVVGMILFDTGDLEQTAHVYLGRGHTEHAAFITQLNELIRSGHGTCAPL